jgi:hypothetical protein
MNCTICGKPIKLVPSASERAAKYGGKPSDYTNLFTVHAVCQVQKNQKDVMTLIKRDYKR